MKFLLFMWIMAFMARGCECGRGYLPNGCPKPKIGERKDKTIQERRHPKKERRTPVYY